MARLFQAVLSHLSPSQKKGIIELLNLGWSEIGIAELYNISVALLKKVKEEYNDRSNG